MKSCNLHFTIFINIYFCNIASLAEAVPLATHQIVYLFLFVDIHIGRYSVHTWMRSAAEH
ncbi:MAG: hypothetical protein A3I66_23290 [Burkholderiales bacterium RIFCSPLOWO2_02_FULL_57_36]|nr:MAG: hypothetical protein A3I66_23290 [Burkholderiales bacterium RIFCSPLOWO2_02_FULL_57_36]